jgi:hypothetical protein
MGETARERIEREFDRPLRDIIVDLREHGCTWRTVALALEVSRSRVYQFRRELGLECTGKRMRDDLSAKPGKVDLAAQDLGYRNGQTAIVDLRMGGLMAQEVADKLGVNVRTIRRHYPPGFAGTVFIKTERYEQTRNRGGNWGIE